MVERLSGVLERLRSFGFALTALLLMMIDFKLFHCYLVGFRRDSLVHGIALQSCFMFHASRHTDRGAAGVASW